MIAMPSFVRRHSRLFGSLALGVVFLTSVFLSYRHFAQRHATNTLTTNSNAPAPQVLAANIDLGEPPEELTELNILLLGYGGAGHSGGFLTDVIQVVHINFSTGSVALISIPRDLWVTLPNGTASKINAAFTLGEDPNKKIESGGQVAKQMASVVTGLPIHYVISTDFVSFKRIIGYALDGVTVDVPETLDDPWYPITGEELNTCGLTPDEVAAVSAQYSGFELEKQFPCRYKHVHVAAGPVTMEGEAALEYVRSRHGSGAGDFSRSVRQQALLKGIRDKLISLEAVADIPKYYKLLSEHVSTDITLDITQYLAPAIQKAGSYEPTSVVLSTENVFSSGKSASGQYILQPKQGLGHWQEVHAFIKNQLDEQKDTE